MEIFSWNDIENLFSKKQKLFDSINLKTGISVGSFDGLHLGHQRLLKTLIDECKTKGCLSGVVSFNRPLPGLKHKSDYPGDVSSLSQRMQLFRKIGLDFVILVDFTSEFAALSGEDFFDILKETCNLSYLVEGVDFKCGYKGATDVDSLKIWGKRNGVDVTLIPPVIFRIDDREERVSSSFIRRLIADGKLSLVNNLLDRNYELDLSDYSLSENGIILRSQIAQVIPRNGEYKVLAFSENDDKEAMKILIKEEGILLGNYKKNCSLIKF